MKNEAYKVTLLPRYIRVGAAPAYLGMDRNRFTAEIRPYLTEIVMGKQSKAFDRLELDAIADQYKERNGRPGRLQGEPLWDGKDARTRQEKGHLAHRQMDRRAANLPKHWIG